LTTKAPIINSKNMKIMQFEQQKITNMKQKGHGTRFQIRIRMSNLESFTCVRSLLGYWTCTCPISILTEYMKNIS